MTAAPGAGAHEPRSRVGGPGRDLLAGAAVTAVVVLSGAPVGLLWARMSPHVQVVLSARGESLAVPETKAFVAADGTLFALGVVAGIACGVLTWRWGRRYGPAAVVGLALGCVLASLVAAEVGSAIGREGFTDARASPGADRVVAAPLRVRATGVHVAWPVASLLAVATLLAYRTPDAPDSGP